MDHSLFFVGDKFVVMIVLDLSFVLLSKVTDFNSILGIHDLFGTELAMIFSFHVGLTDSVMQRMQFFFLSVSIRHFLALF
jgi:hypothetical protein